MSWTGKCGDCGPRLLIENCDALHFKRGPELTRWRRAMVASVGGVLLDDLTPPN